MACIPEDGGRKSFSLDVENVVQKGITKGVQQAASVAVVAYCGAKPRFQLVYFSFIRVTKVWRTSEAISGINIQDLEDGEKPEKVREDLFRLLSGGRLVTHSGAGDLKALGISTYDLSKHNIIHLDITKVFSDKKGPIGLEKIYRFLFPDAIIFDKKNSPRNGHNPEKDARAIAKIYRTWSKMDGEKKERIKERLWQNIETKTIMDF